MQIHHTIQSLREAQAQLRHKRRTVFVPTMGNLHAGHISLLEEARRHGDHLLVSIFVNPMQFGENEDLAAYPRTPQEDIDSLLAAGCDALFAPSVAEMYPGGLKAQTVVSVPEISQNHCGASRPGHFDGVATVVSKLFNIVEPDCAVFGLKDYQQFLVIRRMVADLCFPVRIIGVATKREADGLAMSSRNGYLDAQQRRNAASIYRSLIQAREQLLRGSDCASIEAGIRQQLIAADLRPDYVAVCQADTLEPATAQDQELIILLAAYAGNTRLIDNMAVSRSLANASSPNPQDEADNQKNGSTQS